MFEPTKKDRNKAILEVYSKILKKVARSGDAFTMDDVYDELSRTPAPRFYTSYRKANYFTRLIIKGDMANVPTGKYRRSMYMEIHRRFVKHMEDGDAKTIEEILEEPAPTFYLSKDSLIRIICQNIRNK